MVNFDVGRIGTHLGIQGKMGLDLKDPSKQDNLFKLQPPGFPLTYRLVTRTPRVSRDPVTHYGPIASGSKLLRSPLRRDEFRDKYGVFCVEMEAVGILDWQA